MSAAARWAEALASWRIPDELMAAAAESPWGCDVGRFAARADAAVTRTSPATERALEALTRAGEAAQRGDSGFPGERDYPRRSVSVLDVGCGAGAASVPLLPLATRVTGVDENPRMLPAFLERGLRAGAAVQTVEGRWPDVAGEVEAADVVICHDVLYNVPDAAEFVRRLSDHARIRVVVVVPERHPQEWTRPYWRELHGVERPEEPTVEDAVAVVREAGYDVHTERYVEPTWWAQASTEDVVTTLLRRLCLGPERRDDVRAAVGRHGVTAERVAVALWWDGAAVPATRLL